MWEILTFGARPYPNKQARELLGALQSGERLKQPETCTLDLYAVLLQCKRYALQFVLSRVSWC